MYNTYTRTSRARKFKGEKTIEAMHAMVTNQRDAQS